METMSSKLTSLSPVHRRRLVVLAVCPMANARPATTIMNAALVAKFALNVIQVLLVTKTEFARFPQNVRLKTVMDVARLMAFVEAEMKRKLAGQEPTCVQFVLMDGLAMGRLAYRQPIFVVQTIVQDAVTV